MAKQIRFEEWKPRAILESELPAGVRYQSPCGPPAERMAVDGGRSLCVVGGHGRPCASLNTEFRGDTPVTILDWPEWCGPRPDRSPTWEDILMQCPVPTTHLVWERDGEVAVQVIRGFYGLRGPVSPACGTLLGFLVAS